mmetsp:Transcript_1345/g.2112  ORF Transcript_1345/g.2112 Transcript_1345/m.2112 type:complete len:101 (+) Transcript_1345:321-623(+)
MSGRIDDSIGAHILSEYGSGGQASPTVNFTMTTRTRMLDAFDGNVSFGTNLPHNISEAGSVKNFVDARGAFDLLLVVAEYYHCWYLVRRLLVHYQSEAAT